MTEPAEKALAEQEQKGLAFGWFNLAIGIAALPAGVIFGWIYDRLGAVAAFSWGAGLALLAGILLWGVRPDSTSTHFIAHTEK